MSKSTSGAFVLRTLFLIVWLLTPPSDFSFPFNNTRLTVTSHAPIKLHYELIYTEDQAPHRLAIVRDELFCEHPEKVEVTYARGIMKEGRAWPGSEEQGSRTLGCLHWRVSSCKRHGQGNGQLKQVRVNELGGAIEPVELMELSTHEPYHIRMDLMMKALGAQVD